MKKYFKFLFVLVALMLFLTALEDYKVRNKNLEIKVSGEPDISQDESFKKTFINGVILLILTDAEEVRYTGEDLYFGSIDKDLANEVLKIKYGKEVDDYKKSQEDFDNLIERLKNEKFETGAAKFEMME